MTDPEEEAELAAARVLKTMQSNTNLYPVAECPCCSTVDMRPEPKVSDGDPLLCGCPAWYSVDEREVNVEWDEYEPCHTCGRFGGGHD